jgi:hypothetical protein
LSISCFILFCASKSVPQNIGLNIGRLAEEPEGSGRVRLVREKAQQNLNPGAGDAGGQGFG